MDLWTQLLPQDHPSTRVHLQCSAIAIHLDFTCELLPRFLLRMCRHKLRKLTLLSFNLQLVSSATASPKTDAFNFLAEGAGKEVFDVILKVGFSLTWFEMRQWTYSSQLYIALLFVITVCSLGNRPQGSKWTYSIAIILFGFCNVITLWCAGYTVYLAVPHSVDGWKHIGK